jgi:phage baseplate assembly protein W
MSENPLTNDIVILKNETAIKRSLLNLFSYKRGEKFFNAKFGSGIPDLLFELFDYATAGLIKEEIIKLVERYEPRVNLIDVIIDLDYENNSYEVELEYTILDFSNQSNTVRVSLSATSGV